MKKQMTAVFLSVAVLLLCAWETAAEESGSGFLTVGNYTLVSKKRVNRNVYDFTFRATLTNSGTADVRNVSAVLTDGAVFNEVTDGEVVFGDVPAGGSVTGSDTFTVRINRLYTFDGSRIRWDIRYSSDTPPRVVMGAGMDFMEIPLGESDWSLGITAEFTSYDTDPHTLVFTQTVSPDNGGLTLVRDFEPEYSVSSSMLFILGTGITANAEGTYTLTTAVKIAETGLTAQVSVTVDVFKKETPSLLGTLGIWPTAISISEPADVKFSVGLKTRLKPTEITLEETDEAGNPLRTVGRLVNDGTSGDTLADDFVWTGRFGIDSDTEGRLFFRARAVFPDPEDPVYTGPEFLGITRFPTGISGSDSSKLVTDPATGVKIFSDEVIVWFREGTDPDTIEAAAAAVGGTVAGIINYEYGSYQIKFPGTGDAGGVYNAIRILKDFPEVETAEPAFLLDMHFCSYMPGDSSFLNGGQQGLERMRTDEAWVIAGGKGIIVGVADSGIDCSHPDLFDKAVGIELEHDSNPEHDGNINDLVISDLSYYPAEVYPTDIYPSLRDRVKDYYGHGTAMAGIIAAAGNNDTGAFEKKFEKNMIGIAWESRVLPLKISYRVSDQEILSPAQLCLVIKHAVKQRIKIINYSGYVQESENFSLDELEGAVRTAAEKDVLIVAAGAFVVSPPYPASYSDPGYESLAPNVLSVSTCDSAEYPDISHVNQEANTAAPGIGALVTHPRYDVGMVTDPPGNYNYEKNYTEYPADSPSAATAMASGAAAVVWSAYPELTAAEVKKRLMSSGKALSVKKRYRLSEASLNVLYEKGILKYILSEDESNAVKKLRSLLTVCRAEDMEDAFNNLLSEKEKGMKEGMCGKIQDGKSLILSDYEYDDSESSESSLLLKQLYSLIKVCRKDFCEEEQKNLIIINNNDDICSDKKIWNSKNRLLSGYFETYFSCEGNIPEVLKNLCEEEQLKGAPCDSWKNGNLYTGGLLKGDFIGAHESENDLFEFLIKNGVSSGSGEEFSAENRSEISQYAIYPNQGRGLRRLDLFDALFNGNFDAGLSGWERVPYTGVKVIPALEGEDALLGPYKRMAYLSTEPLESGQEDTGAASLSRSFPIRSGAEGVVISFDYNFSTYEPLKMAEVRWKDVFKAVLKLYSSGSDEKEVLLSEQTLLEKTAASESFAYTKPGILYGKEVNMRISGWKHAAFPVFIPDTVRSGLLEFSLRNIVFCQTSIDGYNFLSFIHASSVVNRQFTLTDFLFLFCSRSAVFCFNVS